MRFFIEKRESPDDEWVNIYPNGGPCESPEACAKIIQGLPSNCEYRIDEIGDFEVVSQDRSPAVWRGFSSLESAKSYARDLASTGVSAILRSGGIQVDWYPASEDAVDVHAETQAAAEDDDTSQPPPNWSFARIGEAARFEPIFRQAVLHPETDRESETAALMPKAREIIGSYAEGMSPLAILVELSRVARQTDSYARSEVLNMMLEDINAAKTNLANGDYDGAMNAISSVSNLICEMALVHEEGIDLLDGEVVPSRSGA